MFRKIGLFLMGVVFFNATLCADAVQQISTEFSKPFHLLFVPEEWTQLESEPDETCPIKLVAFEHVSDEDIEFEFADWGELKSSGSLGDLHDEIQQYIDGKIKIIPMLSEQIEVGYDDDEPEEALGVNFDYPIEHQVINGIEWLKIATVADVREDTHFMDGFETTYYKSRNYIYIAIVDNHIYCVDFSVPAEKNADFEPLFNEVLLHLYTPDHQPLNAVESLCRKCAHHENKAS